MALTGAIAATIYRSAVGVITGSVGRVTEGQLAHRLIAINGQIAGQPFQAYQALARQALRGVAAGQQVQADPGNVLAGRSLPIDPGIQPGDPRYSYRVLVVVADPATGQEVRYATDVQSDDPVSYQTLVNEAQQNFQPWASRRSTGRAIAQLGNNVVVSAEVLSAGRAP